MTTKAASAFPCSLALEPEYEVIWETDPIRALERLQTEPIDLVLLDMVIGPYDGLDILMKIKKLAPLAAVIMMTAYGSIRSSVSAMTRGAFTYLTKPWTSRSSKFTSGRRSNFAV